jgi:anaerobic magnesium-protoporphyrin IX monomethyl ester cyclase
MKLTLLHPPLDDPTIPYHATAYLKGHLVHSGFNDVHTRDVNVEFVNWCLEEENVYRFYQEIETRLDRFQAHPTLNYLQQLEFLELWSHQRRDIPALLRVREEMRSMPAFLDYPRYVNNVRVLNQYFSSLGALTFPASIHNMQHSSKANFSIYNLRDLFDRESNDRACGLFATFFTEQLARDPLFSSTDCFGISVVYDHQLRHALWLAQAIRDRWPEKTIFLGGTAISQCYKYLKNKQDLRYFFTACDALIAGEGETALCEIMASEGSPERIASAPNTITYDRKRDTVVFPAKIHYENVEKLGRPLFEHDWDLYLSPARGVNYAPTRGCYWNRCTFCDYGLNVDSPTSPWRERRIEQVIEDLRVAVTEQQVKYVYFAVDVMAPGYLERLSDAILSSGLDIRWSAELRMEKIFSPERCEKMARSGCVCASFGMESGNQRVLDLIDKGTKVSYMSETMKNFAQAGIAVQLMTFTGFPTETPEEKQATYDFIEINRDYWSAGGTGTFLLTGNAIIARKPEKFGIKLLETKRDDIKRALDYRLEGYDQPVTVSAEEADSSFDAKGGIFPSLLGRPWAGGTDTLHSMIYYDTYGRSFFKLNPLNLGPGSVNGRIDLYAPGIWLELEGELLESRFDIRGIMGSRKKHRAYTKNTLQQSTLPTHWDLVEWQQSLPTMERKQEPSYWIATERISQKLDRKMFALLERLASEPLTAGELLRDMAGDERLRATVYLDRLLNLGLVHLREKRPAKEYEERSLEAVS